MFHTFPFGDNDKCKSMSAISTKMYQERPILWNWRYCHYGNVQYNSNHDDGSRSEGVLVPGELYVAAVDSFCLLVFSEQTQGEHDMVRTTVPDGNIFYVRIHLSTR